MQLERMKATPSQRVSHSGSDNRITLRKLAQHLGLSRTTISMNSQ